MSSLVLHEFHERAGARFTTVNGLEVVEHYGDATAEHAALVRTAGVVDLSFRSRVCLVGADRERFLNGQVTNNVKTLKTAEGCYAALITAKGRMQSDLNIYRLESELLLDFEPGLTSTVIERFEKYIIADDVQAVDVRAHYGLLSVQGPRAEDVIREFEPGLELPAHPLSFRQLAGSPLGEVYVARHARAPVSLPLTADARPLTGFDLFVPVANLEQAAQRLLAAAKAINGRACGWTALETARIEAGIPRFGVDMDESNLAPEAGIEDRAISYSKGCYIGQEVIARIRTYWQVTRTLTGLRLADGLSPLPAKGDELSKDGKMAGYVTSALASPAFKANIALAYVRREVNQPGAELTLRTAAGESRVRLVPLPFAADDLAG